MIKGLAHITRLAGLTEMSPRIPAEGQRSRLLKEVGLCSSVQSDAAESATFPKAEYVPHVHMGVGMVLVSCPQPTNPRRVSLKQQGVPVYRIGGSHPRQPGSFIQ